MRARSLIGVSLALVVGFVAAWLLLPRFLSPAAAEEEREVPPPEPLVATVEEGVLREVLQLEGILEPLATLAVPAPAAATERGIITYLPEAGSVLEPGQVALAISGRPVIFMGDAPNLSRDLHRGLWGEDVAAFQGFLIDMGLLGDHNEGVFDVATENAVIALYARAGFAPVAAEPMDAGVLRETARADVDVARTVLNEARRSNDEAAIAAAEERLRMARGAASVSSRPPRFVVPSSEMLGLPHQRIVVVSTSAPVGSVADPGSSILEVRTEGLMLVSATTRSRASAIPVGQSAQVSVGGQTATLSVTGTRPNQSDPSMVDVIFDWEGEGRPGERFAVEIETQTSGGSVLSVPISAVRTNADGSFFVEVRDGDSTRTVPVEAGTPIGGRVEVAGDLAAGDLVVVGTQ